MISALDPRRVLPAADSSPPRTVLVTGATGFVGSFLVDRLLAEGWNVIALARGRDAALRVHAALLNVSGNAALSAAAHARLRVISADVRDPRLGLNEAETSDLARELHEVWHCAANFGGGSTGETPFSVNVTGTNHLLAFTTHCNRFKPVPFYYVSTAFAGDARDGLTREEPPAQAGQERNDYESSKRAAERAVLAWRQAHGFPAAIFRPSIILGHSRTGRAAGFAAYYDFLRSLSLFARLARSQEKTQGRQPTLRVRTRADLRVNLVTIDFVIDAMWFLARAARGDDAIFHLVNETPVSAGAAIDVMSCSLGLTGVQLVEASSFATQPMTRFERMFHGMIGFERPYLEYETLFDNRRFRRLVPADVLPSPKVDSALLRKMNRGYLDYCERAAPTAPLTTADAAIAQGSVAATGG